MNYLSEIKRTLSSIASEHGLSGVSVELAKDLLAQAIYYSKVNCITLINNNSIDLSNNINTMIQYALSNLYPIYRGDNARIILWGFFSSSDVNIPRGTLVFSSKNFNLYAAHDICPTVSDEITIQDGKWLIVDEDHKNSQQIVSSATDLTKIQKIELIVAKSFSGDKEFDNKFAYYLESINEKDISEDVQIKLKVTGADTQSNKTDTTSVINFTRYVSEHLDHVMTYNNYDTNELVAESIIPLLLTNYNYGLRLYPGFKEDQMVNINGDQVSIKTLRQNYDTLDFLYNYFPYYDYDPTYREIEGLNIQGFQIVNGAVEMVTDDNGKITSEYVAYYLRKEDGNGGYISCFTNEIPDYRNIAEKENIPGGSFTERGIHLIRHVERETVGDGLPYRIQTNLVSSTKLRSKYDITDSFNKYFEKYVYGSSYEWGKNNSSKVLNITYIPKNENIDLPRTRDKGKPNMEDFIDKVMYYADFDISNNSSFPAIAEKYNIDLDIKIYSSVAIDLSLVHHILAQYNYKTNITITYQEILSKINSIDNVKYASLSAKVRVTKNITGNDKEVITKISLSPEYQDGYGLTYLVMSSSDFYGNFSGVLGPKDEDTGESYPLNSFVKDNLLLGTKYIVINDVIKQILIDDFSSTN